MAIVGEDDAGDIGASAPVDVGANAPVDVVAKATFTELARLLRHGSGFEQTCVVLSTAALAVIPGCDHASITVLLSNGTFTTFGATDDVVETADAIQREVGEGPCLEASIDEDIKHDRDLAQNPTWPRFAERLREVTSVRSALACPLVLDGQRGGALNLFADTADAFTDEDVSNAAVLAAFASVAVAGALARDRAEQLSVAVTTNRTIGAAVGILMATHRINQADAFAMLSAASQRVNRKLHDLAADIAAGSGTEQPLG
jgi:GAF domain-containing protein